MKSIKINSKIFLSALVIAQLSGSVSHAQGNHVGGGGTGTELDDTVVLADRYVDVDAPGPNESPEGAIELSLKPDTKVQQFDPLLIKELDRAILMLHAYGEGSSARVMAYGIERNGKERRGLFFQNYVQNAKYYLVKSPEDFPISCPYRMPEHYQAPTGSVSVKLACTQGRYTYIVRSQFAKMPIREQAKLLIHERMRVTPAAGELNPDQLIAQVSDGLEVLLQHALQQERNVDTPFNVLEKKQVLDLRKVIQHFVLHQDREGEFQEHETAEIWTNGGGLVLNGSKKIDPSAFIGVGVMMVSNWKNAYSAAYGTPKSYQQTQMGANAQVTGIGFLCYECSIGAGAKIRNAYTEFKSTGSYTLSSGIQVSESTLVNRYHFLIHAQVGEATELNQVLVRAGKDVGNNEFGTVEDFRVKFLANTQYQNVQVKMHRLFGGFKLIQNPALQ